jgi:hypothetical protein
VLLPCSAPQVLYCYDFQGKELWHSELGKMTHMFGSAASPIIYQDLCFVNFGPDEKARLVAVNKLDGKTVWEAEPPKVDPSEQPQMQRGPGGGPEDLAVAVALARECLWLRRCSRRRTRMRTGRFLKRNSQLWRGPGMTSSMQKRVES